MSLRPWGITCIVSGFPSHISALQFEWAWQNPHLTLHIPSELRIQSAISKKKSGRPKRPRYSLSSLLSNLHLLLRVPSFCRWPLKLHFFSSDVHNTWLKYCRKTIEQIPSHMVVLPDYSSENPSPNKDHSEESTSKLSSTSSIKSLVLDYSNLKSHVETAKEIFDFEQEGSCPLCRSELYHDRGIYTICPNPGCKAVTHITCLSKRFLDNNDDLLLPINGTCPVCHTENQWVDLVKELSLRIRGEKEVQNLMKVRRGRKKHAADAYSPDSIDLTWNESAALNVQTDFGRNLEDDKFDFDTTSTISSIAT